MGKREKQIVRTRGSEREHMDVILQNTVDYNFYKARAHIKAITGDFTAHLGCSFSNLCWGLDCCHSGGNANKRFCKLFAVLLLATIIILLLCMKLKVDRKPIFLPGPSVKRVR